jgi:hypothetical protein
MILLNALWRLLLPHPEHHQFIPGPEMKTLQIKAEV